MSRIRTIKPDFFQSPSVAELSHRARLTFIGLWTYVDDEGRCRNEPRVIAGLLWPLDDDVNGPEVADDITAMCVAGLVALYTEGGKRYLAVRGWKEHQRINRPTKSKLPPPPVDESSRSRPFSPELSPELSLGEDSVRTHGGKGEGEGKGSGKGKGNGEGGGSLRTPDPDAPWCDRHPGGTSEPCRDCANARQRWEYARERAGVL